MSARIHKLSLNVNTDLIPSLSTALSPQELQVSAREKDKQIKELEIELLTASQKLAAGANDHAEQMQDQADQLDKCKVQYTLCV